MQGAGIGHPISASQASNVLQHHQQPGRRRAPDGMPFLLSHSRAAPTSTCSLIALHACSTGQGAHGDGGGSHLAKEGSGGERGMATRVWPQTGAAAMAAKPSTAGGKFFSNRGRRGRQAGRLMKRLYPDDEPPTPEEAARQAEKRRCKDAENKVLLEDIFGGRRRT
jgi:hypothetical protein